MTDEHDEHHGADWAAGFAAWIGSKADHDDQARRDLAAERAADYTS